MQSQNPEDRLFLTVDFEGDFMALVDVARDFGGRVHAVKLGQGFLLDERAHKLRKHLLHFGTRLYLDAKYEDDSDQMTFQVRKVADQGYTWVSISPSAGVASIMAAGYEQNGLKAVAALSNDPGLYKIQIRNLHEANELLEEDDGQKIETVMCNVGCIEQVKSLGGFSIIATGIRMPGDESHDQPAVATPEEALSMGADYLAIGRAITASQDKKAAFERILENISLIR